MHRFYVPDLPDEGALIALPPDEARHLTTSVGIGLALYRASDAASRKTVANAVKQAMSGMLTARFGDTRSMLHARLAREALNCATAQEVRELVKKHLG